MPRKYTRAQKEVVARKLHELLSYVAITIFYTSRKILSPDTDPEKKEEEIAILDSIELTAQTLYEDLEPEQHKFLKQLAKSILDEI